MPKLKHPETGHVVSVGPSGAETFRARGYIDASASDAATGRPPRAAAAPARLERPAQAAPKADWVAYATQEGVADADDLTKADLVDLVGEGDA